VPESYPTMHRSSTVQYLSFGTHRQRTLRSWARTVRSDNSGWCDPVKAHATPEWTPTPVILPSPCIGSHRGDAQ
jgi:hypothetical protein